MTKDEYELLLKCADLARKYRSEVVLEGIKKVYEEVKNDQEVVLFMENIGIKSLSEDRDQNAVLVQVNNGQIVASSRDIAEHFGKRHNDVTETIRKLLDTKKSVTKFFSETSFTYRGQEFPAYLMNRDGFSLLVMGFTGAKALDWKLKYIEAFNRMEKELKERDFVKPVVDVERNQIDLNNSKARLAELWMKLADRSNIPEFKQIADTYAANTLAGETILALPPVDRKTYSATEVGEMLSVSANKIGRLANANNLKTEQYDKYFYDKAKHSNKEIETFRYYDNAVEIFRTLLA